MMRSGGMGVLATASTPPTGAGAQHADDLLEKLQRAVEGAVVAAVLDHGTCVRHRRAIAAEEVADLRQAQTQRDMGDVHADLAGEGDAGVAAAQAPECGRLHGKYPRNGLLHRVADERDLHAAPAAAPDYTRRW